MNATNVFLVASHKLIELLIAILVSLLSVLSVNYTKSEGFGVNRLNKKTIEIEKP